MQPVTPKYKTLAQAFTYLKTLRLRSRETVAILSRHGKTVFNEQHLLQAWKPDEDRLCEQGKQDTRKLRRVIANAPIPIPIRLVSDMRRARQTISPAPRGHHAIKLSVLRDINYGNLGGLSYQGDNNNFESQYPDLYHCWVNSKTRRNFTAPGGENWLEFEDRIRVGLQAVIMPKIQGKISFIVSHVGTTREILFNSFGGNISEWKPTIVGASITIIHFGIDSSPTLLLYNNTDHLEA